MKLTTDRNNRLVYEGTCAFKPCGRPFKGERSTKAYCSDLCRRRASRERAAKRARRS